MGYNKSESVVQALQRAAQTPLEQVARIEFGAKHVPIKRDGRDSYASLCYQMGQELDPPTLFRLAIGSWCCNLYTTGFGDIIVGGYSKFEYLYDVANTCGSALV